MPIPDYILRENPEIGKQVTALLRALREANPLIDVGKVGAVREAINKLVMIVFRCAANGEY